MRLSDISNEAILLGGGARAILLQLAMPAVGHGVANHSDFSSDPLRRLRHTLTYLYVLVYGTDAEKARITGHVNRAHAPVHSAPGAPAPSYDAFDPRQQLWVAATLYDSALTVYTAIFGELAADDAESLYRQYAVLGTALQMPAELWPEDRAAFARYWAQSLRELRVDADVSRVGHALLHPAAAPPWIRGLMPAVRFLTAGFLDPSTRASFDLPWNARRQRLFDRTVRVLAAVYPRLPLWLRRWPARHYLAAFRASAASPSAVAA
ncbi:oxygenase MpaB family protein [Conyzicola sp.]|uniref:oxygenase MpaB family protein n=1 Tax=Conyzicola sp. TaxID=1969404 RepID=UPI003989F98F